MRSVDEITDPEVLRQAAQLLERENRRLIDRLRELEQENAKLRRADALTAQQEMQFLRELLARRERALFGASSEKRGSSNSELTSDTPQTGHGPREQAELALVEQVHELDQPDRVCPKCGGELVEMGGQFEESEEVTVLERRFVLVRHRRKKYRCSCNACIETALGPPRLRPGARYSPEFAVEVAISKYQDHLPLERQVKIMAREGLVIDSQTLWDQLDALRVLLEPSWQALRTQILGDGLVHADETWWRLMDAKGSTRWWAWSLANRRGVFYEIRETRSSAAARELLREFRGVAVVDGYSVYGLLSRAGPEITLAHCWAHVRRKFIEAEQHAPEACREIVELIGALYGVEREAADGDEDGLFERRRLLRESRSRPIVAKVHEWMLAQRALPRSSLGRAIAYMAGLWTGLTRFLDDPRVPLDNNLVERALRGVVLGRKNHYGSRSRRGTEAAAILYSLIETAKMHGVDPKTYLLRAVHAAIADSGSVTLPQPV